MQRTWNGACRERSVGAISIGQRLVGQNIDDGVDLRINRSHAIEAGLHGFSAGDAAAADGASQIGR